MTTNTPAELQNAVRSLFCAAALVCGFFTGRAEGFFNPADWQENPELLGGVGLVMKAEAGRDGVRIYCHHNPNFSGLPRPLGIHGFDYGKGRPTDHHNVPSPRISFGDIRPGAGAALELDDWEGDWSHRKYSWLVTPEKGKDFFAEKQFFSLELSRLHPALAVESDGDFLFFYGGKDADVPGFVAWRGPQGVETRAIGEAGETLRLPEPKWLLFWLGRDAASQEGPGAAWYRHHDEDPRTLRMKLPVRGVQTFRGIGDVPLLVACLTPAVELEAVQGEGVELTFAEGARVVMLPPYGLGHPLLETTQSWKNGLPESVAALCDEWAELARRLPRSCRESYAYEPESDTVVISETFRFGDSAGLPVAAPLPPMLALALSMGMPMEVLAGGKTVVPRDTGLLTAYGPYMVVDDAGSYEIRLSGLGRYVSERRVVKPRPAEPSGLYLRFEQRLAAELDAVVRAGHLAGMALPIKVSIYSSGVKGAGGRFYAATGLALEMLARAGAVVGDDALRAGVLEYMKRERLEYPPERAGVAPPRTGARREPWPVSALIAQEEDAILETIKRRGIRGFHETHGLVPVENFYGLAEYYLALGGKSAFAADNAEGQLAEAVNSAIAPWLQRPDWASFGWRGWDSSLTVNDIEYGGKRTSDLNRMIAGLIGYVRLMRMAGRKEDEELGMALLGRALAQRHAVARYAEYLYKRGVLPLPEGESPLKDIRPLSVDEEGVYLYTLTGYYWCMGYSHYLGPYMGMVPELGRFAADHFREHAAAYVSEIARLFPDWFMRAGCTPVRDCEDHINKPTDSQQVFNVHAWVLGKPAGELARFVDAPWALVGDWYFIERLAETLAAWRGATWNAIE